MDKIVDHINTHSAELGATIRYGTMGQFLDILHGSGKIADWPSQTAAASAAAAASRAAPSSLALPVVSGDFFPMDTECCGPVNIVNKVWNCWTGFFSSFPALKHATRKLEHTLRHAEILSLLATSAGVSDATVAQWELALGWGRHTSGIMQHHDALTGTGGSSCDLEFHTVQSARGG